VVISGSSSEQAHVQSVINRIDKKYAGRILDTSGKLSMKAFITMVSRCDLMLTNDSGPMHLAMALQVPLVALFGPGSPIHYAMPARATVITKNIHCSPCVHLHPESPCGGDNQCMKQITVPEVFEACHRHLQTATRESQVLATP
jgi:heptosyltransferase-2